jgi:hypothetical protein
VARVASTHIQVESARIGAHAAPHTHGRGGLVLSTAMATKSAVGGDAHHGKSSAVVWGEQAVGGKAVTVGLPARGGRRAGATELRRWPACRPACDRGRTELRGDAAGGCERGALPADPPSSATLACSGRRGGDGWVDRSSRRRLGKELPACPLVLGRSSRRTRWWCGGRRRGSSPPLCSSPRRRCVAAVRRRAAASSASRPTGEQERPEKLWLQLGVGGGGLEDWRG